MTSLPDLNITPVMDTSEHDLTLDFFKPLLSVSVRYDRGVGPILAYKSKSRWFQDLNHQIMEYNAGYRNFISAYHSTPRFLCNNVDYPF
jgi:hypothetical protein